VRRVLAIVAAVAAVGIVPATAGAADPTGTPPPNLVRGLATSQNTVDVQFNEPVDPNSVQTNDFILEMTEANRPVIGAAVSPDGTKVTLTSSTFWDPGTAGQVHLTAPGVILDPAGVPNSAADWVTVGAAPGDFAPPVVTHFHLTKSHGLCFTYNVRRCKRPGAAWIYRVTEDGDAFFTVFRHGKVVGVRRYNGQPGSNYINFDGKINGRRLPRGVYSVRLGVKDVVGNMTPIPQQPRTRFSVKRR
jgi:Big-like domain-containing protein